jgi:hypothetical protein
VLGVFQILATVCLTLSGRFDRARATERLE